MATITQKSRIPNEIKINNIIIEDEMAYSYHLNGFIPFLMWTLYLSNNGNAINKCATADANKNNVSKDHDDLDSENNEIEIESEIIDLTDLE